MVGQKLVAPGSVKISGKVYLVARDRDGKLVYTHKSGPVERGLGLWEKVAFRDGLAGMGYSVETPNAPEEGFYYSQKCLNTVAGALQPNPLVTVLSSAMTTEVRHFFEAEDSAGNFYLYALGVGEIAKIKLGATPTLVSVFTASPIQSTDKFGKPVRSRIVEAAFQSDAFQEDAFSTIDSDQWILPVDSGKRMIELTQVGIDPTADTWNLREDVSTGASQFAIAAENFWRAVSSDFGTKISACDILNDPAVGVNWGDEFPVGDQGAKVTALIPLHRFVFVITEGNIFGATEDFNADVAGGAISFSEMLPDMKFQKELIDGAPVTGMGAIGWDASVLIPAPYALYQHSISDYRMVGPDSFLGNNGIEPNLTDQIRFGRQRGMDTTGHWIYCIYEMADGSGFYILAGRKRKDAEGGIEPLVWQPIYYRATGRALAIRVTRNGVGDPRLVWSVDNGDFEWISLGLDGGPFKPGGSYGKAGASGIWFGKEFDLDEPGTPKLLREAEIVVDGGVATLTWQNKVQRDGGAADNVGSGITVSGTQFFASNVSARRIRPIIQWSAAGGYTPAGNVTKVRKIIYRGSWLPNVSDEFTFLVDILATARRQGVSPKKVRLDLNALVLSGSYSFIDLHGASAVQVIVAPVEYIEGTEKIGLEGREIAKITVTVHELS